jgi:hypothetical protein
MSDDVSFEVQIPPEQEGGAYANFLSVWHTGHEFTLDFAVTQPTRETDMGAMVVPCPARRSRPDREHGRGGWGGDGRDGAPGPPGELATRPHTARR